MSETLLPEEPLPTPTVSRRPLCRPRPEKDDAGEEEKAEKAEETALRPGNAW
jgi:hypothetical protein